MKSARATRSFERSSARRATRALVVSVMMERPSHATLTVSVTLCEPDGVPPACADRPRPTPSVHEPPPAPLPLRCPNPVPHIGPAAPALPSLQCPAVESSLLLQGPCDGGLPPLHRPPRQRPQPEPGDRRRRRRIPLGRPHRRQQRH